MRRLIFVGGWLAVAACESTGDTADRIEVDAGAVADAGEHDAGGRDAGRADAAACVPSGCPLDACGAHDDGCGATLQCTGGCACADFLTDCPERPCERAVGCADGGCVYAPVSCGEQTCACRSASCDDSTPRACGEAACPGQFCDPAPFLDGAVLRFANACIADVRAPCGTCDLGLRVCDAEAGVVCEDVALPGIDPARAECDATRATSTFVFLDDEYPGDDADGSRERPFADLDAALAAAAQRNAAAIVIGGSPVFERPLVLRDGISLLGGYSRRPAYQRDPIQRPRWVVGAEHVADGRLVGVLAADVTRPTLLQGVAVETASLADLPAQGAGATNHAVFAIRAPGLALVDVRAVAGDAGHGADGARGQDATAPEPRGAADGEGPSADRMPTDAWLYRSATADCAGMPPPPLEPGRGGTPEICPGDEPQPPLTGGDGGRSAAPGSDAQPEPGRSGADGTPGGAAGPCEDRRCTGADGPRPEDDPPPGATGADAPPYTVQDGRFVPRGHGARGVRGPSGHPGGGGGAGAAYVARVERANVPGGAWLCGHALPGAGGGAGGCGGEGGGGGHPGGFSFGLFVADSPGLRVEGGSFGAGRGGDGGDGNRGGRGWGEGGQGGAAAALRTQDHRDTIEALFCVLDAQDPAPFVECRDDVNRHLELWARAASNGGGGRGSGGRDGAHGGAGAGGSSVAIYCHGAGVRVADAAAAPGEPGAGGEPVASFGCE